MNETVLLPYFRRRVARPFSSGFSGPGSPLWAAVSGVDGLERAECRESIVGALDNSSDLKPFERPDVGRTSRRECGGSCYIAGSVPDA